MGHQRSQEKGWVRFRGSPEISFPEDLQDQNERFLYLKNFLLFLARCASSIWNTLSLSPSPTLFLKASSDPSRFQCSMRSMTITNGVLLTDKWETAWDDLGPHPISECLYCFCWRVVQRFLGLHSTIRLERLDFSCMGGECGPGSRKSHSAAAGLLGLGELLKAGFVGQQKVPGSRTCGRGTGLLTAEETWNSLATQVQQVHVHGAWKLWGSYGREGEQLGSLLWVCALPSKASLGLRIQTGQETSKDFKFVVLEYFCSSYEVGSWVTTIWTDLS